MNRRCFRLLYQFPSQYSKLSSTNLSEELLPYLDHRTNTHGKIFLMLFQYLRRYACVGMVSTFEKSNLFPNGTKQGIIKFINGSDADVSVIPVYMVDSTVAAMDFAYPYQTFTHTFVTPRSQYKPLIFGIFQTLSPAVWLTIISVFILMVLAYYIFFKSKYAFNKILLHVLAILMRQNSILMPSSFIESILIYSWVIGAMFLCLAYDSVFLSFLALPPVTKIKHLSDLAAAVENGEYHCMAYNPKGFGTVLRDFRGADQKHFKVIGSDIMKNNASHNAFEDFIRDSTIRDRNLAFIIDTTFLDRFAGQYMISEDRFAEMLAAMPVRKGFCCKHIIDTFVHRIMAAGIWFKIFKSANFFKSLRSLLKYSTEIDTRRKLTLTDVAPAFIILLIGYLISCLSLAAEIWSHRKTKQNHLRRNARRMRKERFTKISV